MLRTVAHGFTLGDELYSRHNTGFLDDTKDDIRLRIGLYHQRADQRHHMLHEIAHTLGCERSKLSKNGEL